MAKRTLPPQEYLREAFSYDPGSGVLLWKTRPVSHFKHTHACAVWNATHPGKQFGSPDGRYLSGHLDGRKAFAHRIIWKIVTGVDPEHLDHADGNGRHNVWLNLRNATPAQNSWNQQRKQLELPKGTRKSKGGNYEARITVGGDGFHLGTFATVREAHEAYCAAARLHFGEFWNPG